MPPREWTDRLKDMLQAIRSIQRLVEGLDYDQFVADETRVYAAAYCVEIIGEASRHIPEHIQSSYPQLPWIEMRTMRNIVAHEYFRLNLPVLWRTLSQEIPELAPAFEEILNEHR